MIIVKEEDLSTVDATEAQKESEIDPTLNIEPRILGLAMVPGKHIVSIHLDDSPPSSRNTSKAPANSPIIDSFTKLKQEGEQGNSETEENIDSHLEAATKKIESMYT